MVLTQSDARTFLYPFALTTRCALPLGEMIWIPDADIWTWLVVVSYPLQWQGNCILECAPIRSEEESHIIDLCSN